MLPIELDAIEIITDTGNGIPVSYSNAAIGLASDGHFAVITGRPGLAGSPKIITGDTDREVWYQNILVKKTGAYQPSTYCNFVRAGAFQDSSGLEFAIKNTALFYATCEANGVELARRRVLYYKVKSLDGITFHFSLRWQGVIDNQPFNETTYKIRCISAEKQIFKTIPNRPATSISSSDSASGNKDKMIPVAIGRVAYSPLVNITKPGKKAILNFIDGVAYEMTAIQAIGTAGFFFLTRGMYFVENDPRLMHKYFSVLSGGKPQSYRIRAVTETVIDVDQRTGVLVDSAPDATGFVSWDANDDGIGDDGVASVWYAEITDYKPTLIVSTLPIAEVKKNAAGRPGLALFKNDRDVFDDVSEIRSESSLTNISQSGFPGYTILAKTADTDGSLFTFFNIAPTAIVLTAITGWTTEDIPDIGASAEDLFNKEPTGGYTVTNAAGGAGGGYVEFDVSLPSDSLLKQFEEIYILPDYIHSKSGGGSFHTRVTVKVWGKDFLGRLTEPIFEDEIRNSELSGSETRHFIPGEYYGISRDDTLHHAQKTRFNIATLLGDTKKSRISNSVRIRITVFHTGAHSGYTLNLLQIGLVGKRAVGVTSEPVYGTVRGEIFGNPFHSGESWGAGRGKAHDAAVDTGVEAIEHMIRKYDEPTAWWESDVDVVEGQIVRPSDDNGYVYVCTVPGHTESNTEPTWPTDVGDTVVDNTATWKCLREIPIDTAAFDVANGQLSGMFVGSTLTDPKDSLEIYEDLFEKLFLIGIIDAAGNVKIKSWLDNRTPLMAFHTGTAELGKILVGTLGEMTLSPMRDVFVEYRINYDKNYATKKFNRQISLVNTDKPEFPARDAFITPGEDLGTFENGYLDLGGGLIFVLIETEYPRGVVIGDLITISGSTDGYNFPAAAVVSILTATRFAVHVQGLTPTTGLGGLVAATGTVTRNAEGSLAWTRYVSGFIDYDKAKAVWEDAKSARNKIMSSEKHPDDLGNCHWFIDPYAKDAAGKYIWSEDGTAATLDLDVGDEHPAVFYLRRLISWTARQKKQIEFEVPDTDENSVLEVGDPVTLTDSKLTNGAALLGWIHEKSQLSATKNKPSRFRFGLTLEPI